MTITQPQDRKPAAGTPFKFKVGAKSHALPSADKARAKLSGRDVRDAAMGGEIGQMAFLFKAVEASGATPVALNALYDLPGDEAVQILSDWAEYGDGDGASLGE